MNVEPIDVTALVAVVLGSLMVLIPVAGLTARFALKPLVESIGRFMQAQGADEAMKMSERRIALLEQNLDTVQDEVRRLREAHDFEAALQSGRSGGALQAESSGAARSS